jgi:hypothetical protein
LLDVNCWFAKTLEAAENFVLNEHKKSFLLARIEIKLSKPKRKIFYVAIQMKALRSIHEQSIVL